MLDFSPASSTKHIERGLIQEVAFGSHAERCQRGGKEEGDGRDNVTD
jgi:hypothetical protein